MQRVDYRQLAQARTAEEMERLCPGVVKALVRGMLDVAKVIREAKSDQNSD